LQIVDGKRVGGDVAHALRPALILRVDQVGPDGLDLVQHILLAGHADGDHQNERGGADHHAQRGQKKSHLVAHEGLVSEAENLAQRHVRPQAGTHRGDRRSHIG
jgi:hypothetical protein